MSAPLHIVSAGACTPAGFTLAANVAAFRSGLNGFCKPDQFRDQRNGDAVAMSMLEPLEESSVTARMRHFAEKAAAEAMRPFISLPPVRVAFLLALSEDRPGLDSTQSLSDAVINAIPPALKPQSFQMETAGNVGAIVLIQKAQELLAIGEVDVCLIGGADSFAHTDALHWFEDHGRLKSSEQPNGLIPGEGAGFFVATRSDVAKKLGLPSMAEISGVASAEEPKPWHTGEATLGQGLTQTIRRTFSSASAPEADAVYGDINGESWRAAEWSYASLRNGKRFKSPLTVFHPASSWGETGAASSPLAIAAAAAALLRSQQDKAFLVWSASGTSGLRASCLLKKEVIQ